MTAEKPDFYCWPCDRRFALPGDGFPPQSGVVVCGRCGSTDVYWLRPRDKTADPARAALAEEGLE